MKKLLGIATLALACVAVSTPRASAWSNFHFGVGLDLSYQGAGNCVLWGLWRGSNVDGSVPPCFGSNGYAAGYGYGAPGYDGAVVGDGHGYPGYPAVGGQTPPGWVAPAPTPGGQPAPDKKDNGKKNDDDQARAMQRAAYYYQAAGYTQNPGAAQPYNYYGQYPYPAAYPYGAGSYPYGASYYQTPSYWWQGR
jgi:hypothetical protein